MGAWLDKLRKTDRAARQRVATFAVIAVAAVLMLAGGGKALLRTYESLAKTDQLAAVSLILSGVPDGAVPVTLLDVDDLTRQAWRSQTATPHAALAALVHMAQTRGAAAILLDFDLSADRPDTPADPALAGLLQNYPANAPVLMLVRQITFPAGSDVATSTITPYDEMTASRPNIVWVSALNDGGGIRSVRRIRFWQTVCAGSDGLTYPSVPLVIAGRVIDGGRNSAALDRFLAGRTSQDCGSLPAGDAAWPPVQDAEVVLPYVFGNEPGARALMRIRYGGQETVLLRRIRGSDLVRHQDGLAVPAGDIHREPFEGRVVVVGASYSGNRDIYQTPLGMMPGAVIMANSVVQARRMVETPPASPAVAGLVAVAMLGLCAAAARFLHFVAAVLAIAGLSLAVLFLMGRLYGFGAGYEVLAMALPGFALFKLADGLLHMAMEIPRRGWRVLFK